jgi:hypothetical protein
LFVEYIVKTLSPVEFVKYERGTVDNTVYREKFEIFDEIKNLQTIMILAI